MEAAARQGLALAGRALVQADLDAGRLMRAAPGALDRGEGFHLLWTPSAGPGARAARDWLLAQGAPQAGAPPGAAQNS
ncbi:MAG: hypothetical protein AAGI51_01505 [Pseudomonadota bacterium]